MPRQTPPSPDTILVLFLFRALVADMDRLIMRCRGLGSSPRLQELRLVLLMLWFVRSHYYRLRHLRRWLCGHLLRR